MIPWVCSAASSDSPVFEKWTHPDNWRKPELHGARFTVNPDECRACHGNDLKGGTSRIGCGECHATSVHQPRNDFSMSHPQKVKQATGTMSGFVTCRKCHGIDFTGTALSNSKGCMATSTCHFHPEGMPHDPWNGKSLDFIQHTHTDTDPANALVCVPCHNRVKKHTWYDGKGKPVTYGNLLKPPAGAPPETAPGCFNSTLCHDRELPSPRSKQ
jgi:hypothetical protein